MRLRVDHRACFPRTPPAATRAAQAAVDGRLILVIEDNVDAGETLAQVLRVNGHQVSVALDGRTGIAEARRLVPDVVLCDIGLPDFDGHTVARTLRADATLRATRLIALTGYAQPEDCALARESGFDAHLAKPAPRTSWSAVAGAGGAPRVTMRLARRRRRDPRLPSLRRGRRGGPGEGRAAPLLAELAPGAGGDADHGRAGDPTAAGPRDAW
jgi:CheY-like chemotaxis protein